MMKRHFIHREGGFTFAEILVTIAIMAAVLPSLLKVFSDISRSQAIADNRVTALNLLKFQWAEIERNGYPEPGQQSGEFGENSIFQWDSNVENMDSDEIQGLSKVNLTITWQHLGKVRSIGISTFMADREIQ